MRFDRGRLVPSPIAAYTFAMSTDARSYFLGWQKPILPEAVRWLTTRYASDGQLDLGSVVILVSGGRAGRRLLELLVAEAEERKLTFTPPIPATPGTLAERFVDFRRPWAGPLPRQIAWVKALQKSDRETLAAIVPFPPEENDWLGWTAIADRLDSVHAELAGHRLDFAQVGEKVDEIAGFEESRRWLALASIHQHYLEGMAEGGFVDPHHDTERALAESAIRADLELVTAGAIDLNRVHRAIFDVLGPRAMALVPAPQEEAAGFDSHGTVVDAYWANMPLPIDDAQLVIADRPIDQAASAIERIAELGDRFSANQITLGVCDETLTATLAQQLQAYGLKSRNAAGLPLSQTRPARLLVLIANWIERSRYTDFAALIRHVDVAEYLEKQCGRDVARACQTLLDQYQEQALQSRLDGKLPGSGQRQQRLKEMLHQVTVLCSGLVDGRRPLGQWAEAVAELLVRIFGQRPLERYESEQRVILEVCEKIGAKLRDWVSLESGPHLTAPNAIRLLLAQVGEQPIPPEPMHDAIEMLGPLELVLDDAPVLILTGFNEGSMPTSQTSDALLPDRLRTELGLNNNAHRLARDMVQLRAMLESDRETVLIAGRRDAEDNPLLPSRLMFSGDQMAQRVKRFTRGSESRYVAWPADWKLAAETQIAMPPEPAQLQEPVRHLRVTAFRDYLACPYRFYLRHIEELEPIDDAAQELSAAAFGSLAHEALQEFADHDVSRSTDPTKISQFFDRWLSSKAAKQFGRHPMPAVRVQIAQLARRLHRFAQWQAAWREEGWQLERAEIGFTGREHDEAEVPFEVDGEVFFLRGRIDRIDRHAKTGRLAVIDYKTSDAGGDPEKVHRKGRAQQKEWKDLQLPLYRVLVGSLGLGEIDKLGYLLLPKDTSRVGPAWAAWEESDYEDAEEKAREVVRAIREEIFWPPSSVTSPFDSYAALCGVGQLARTAMGERDGGDL